MVLAVFMLPGTVTPTHAAVYKCIGTDGSTTYNDAPCAADESTRLLSKSARELSVLDCRVAHNFAFDAVARMRQDDSAEDVFEAYGGADKLSDGARNLINHVFSFRDDAVVSSQRIVDLTIERCQAGLLSKALDQCESFPEEFIERFGGCLKARESDQTVLIQTPATDPVSSQAGNGTSQTLPPKLKAAKPVSDKASTSDRTTEKRLKPSLENDDSRASQK